MPNNIFFHTQNISLKFAKKRIVKNWLSSIIINEGKNLGEISIVFCSDDYLLEINKKYLSHDYFTDVITFNYNHENYISGDIFISIDRVKENAQNFSSNFESELHRVIVHGVLHLLGYKDKSVRQENAMRKKEEEMLLLLYIV